MSAKIKNVIFDLGDVLVTGIKDTGVALTEKYKLQDAIKHNIQWNRTTTPLLIPLITEFFHGNVSEDEYIKAVLAEYPMIGDHAELKQHIRDNFLEVEGTRDIILELKRQKYRLGLLSVHTKEWIEYCESAFNYHELFDVRSYSYETKLSKPDPLAFHEVIGKLKARAEECIFIDDSDVNVNVAQALGMHGIIFTTAAALRNDLKQEYSINI